VPASAFRGVDPDSNLQGIFDPANLVRACLPLGEQGQQSLINCIDFGAQTLQFLVCLGVGSFHAALF
jgi:hypothetical protein